MNVPARMSIGSTIVVLFSMIFGAVGVFFYIGGLVLAKGFWQTTFALFPLYSWYLVVERVMKLWGWA